LGRGKGIVKTAEELSRRGAKRVGIIGPLGGPRWKQLETKFELVSFEAEYVKLRLIKSEEEIAWLRIGAALSDAGMAALVGGTRAGMTEQPPSTKCRKQAFVDLLFSFDEASWRSTIWRACRSGALVDPYR
jgi:Xaa-Pro aminopeptidase